MILRSKQNCLLLAALCASLLCASSCLRDPSFDNSSAVKFKAFARSSSAAATKTQYAGGNVATGQKERLNWVAGDLVSLTSPQADGKKKADYKIASHGTPDSEYSVSTLQNLTEKTNGLQWGTGTHFFYGVYPATESISNNVITATLPKAQTYSGPPSVSTVAGVEHSFIYPDMQLAWMFSGQQVEAGNEVSLYFSPMVTTFQLSVTGLDEEEIDLTEFRLSSEHCALQGSYKATVSVSGPVDRTHLGNMSVAYSEIPARSAGANDELVFTLPSGVKVSSTKKVTFTVFAYPQGASANPAVLDGLSLRFVSADMDRSLKLKYAQTAPEHAGEWVQFPAGKKINIDGLTLPKQVDPWTFTVEVDNWEEEISDVAVTPVQVEEWEHVDNDLPVDEWTPLFGVSPETSSVWVGDEITITAYYFGRGILSEASPVDWTLSDTDGTYVTTVSTTGSSITLRGVRRTTTGSGILPVTVTATKGGQSASAQVFVKKLSRSGAFYVGKGKYVYFAPGNLQYVFGAGDAADPDAALGESCSTGYWRFAEHQYDFIGPVNHADLVASKTPGTAIDLFSFGDTGFNYESGRFYKPWIYDADLSEDTYGPSRVDLTVSGKSDWGANTIQGANPQTGWRTLTADEFNFMATSAAQGRNGKSQLFGTARVAGVKGLVFLPDDWVMPVGLPAFVPGVEFGNTMVINNQYSAGEWELMEAAGAVFFPTTGIIRRRTAPTEYVVQDYQNAATYDYLAYRTASRANDNFGWFGANSLSTVSGGSSYTYRGKAAKLPVRLVRDAGDVTHGLNTGLGCYAMRFTTISPNHQATGVRVKYDGADVTAASTITWHCTNTGVADMTVTPGGQSVHVLPKADGKADIVCTVKYGSETQTLVCKVLVELD